MPWSTVTRHGVQRRKKPRVLMQVGAALVLGLAAAVGAQEATEPSPIEHALVEYLCRTVQRPALIGTEAYQSCYTAQLATLREPFGRNLAGLSAADRKSIDGRCGDFQATRGRDAYLSCLHDQLLSIRERRGLGKPIEAALAPPQVPVESAPVSIPAPVSAAQPSSSAWWVVGVLALAASAGGAAFVVWKRRAVPQNFSCRGCGVQLPAAGDLCADCRHEAADARRREIAGRADQERQDEEQQRREVERIEDEARRAAVRQEEMLRAQADKERRQHEERERRLRAARDVRDEEASTEFDPYVILGIEADATAERVRAAYEAAKARYDPREYEHLGLELREHFRAKAAAVERAYLLLALPEYRSNDRSSPST